MVYEFYSCIKCNLFVFSPKNLATCTNLETATDINDCLSSWKEMFKP